MDAFHQEIILHRDIDFSDPHIIDRIPNKHRRSPIMVTIVDPNTTQMDFQKMMELGINSIMFKASHCTTGEKTKLLGHLDIAVTFLSKKYATHDWPINTCMELKTSIVRTGVMERNHAVRLEKGMECVLIYDIDIFDKCTADSIFVDDPYIGVDVAVDMLISISQDEIEMKCIEIIDSTSIKCVVTKGGQLDNMSLVAVKGRSHLSMPLITKKDFNSVQFALDYQFDMILINFARSPATIHKVKQYINKNNKEAKKTIILAGVCGPEGLRNIDDIIKESDGIVFSREFLAYELDVITGFRLLNIQKLVNAKCQQAGKPFYLSGELFRQALTVGEFDDNETSDITNAILYGTTGFILKHCSSVDILLNVIRAMNDLCCTVEPLTNSKTNFWRIIESIRQPVNAAEASAIACAALAHQKRARIIVIPTVTGDTAKTLMWLRPASIVITVSTKRYATRRLQFYRCVVPLMYKGEKYEDWYKAVDARVGFAVEYAVKMGWLKLGDAYVTLQRGSEDSAFCDMVRSWQVKISQRARVECSDDSAENKKK